MMHRSSCFQLRLAGSVLAFSVAANNAFATADVTPASPSSAQMVDALNGVFGAHERARANHAKGILMNAIFTPARNAEAISRAPHFKGGPTAVLVRFSNFGGFPNVGDADPNAAPYGISLKFALGSDQETDLVMHSYNGFPSATAADFVDFLTAMGKGPAMLDRYAAAHPSAREFLAAAKPAPASFGSQAYFGVNTFKFTNAAGQSSYGRYRMVPLGAARYLNAQEAAAASADYLQAEIRQRLAAGPLLMRLQLQLATTSDALENPSIAWPETRRLVDLGTLSITATLDNVKQAQTVVFIPDELPDGIEASDPMISARTRAYTESLQRRVP